MDFQKYEEVPNSDGLRKSKQFSSQNNFLIEQKNGPLSKRSSVQRNTKEIEENYEYNIERLLKPKLKIKRIKEKEEIVKRKMTFGKITNALPMLSPGLVKKVTNQIDNFEMNGEEKPLEDNLVPKLTFKDILPASSVQRILSSRGEKSTRNEPSVFRSEFYCRTEPEMTKELNKEIAMDKVNIITYINSKENVSELLIKKLTSSDEKTLVKVDKLCKKVILNKEEDNKFKKYVEEKLNKRREYELSDCVSTLNSIESNLSKARGIQHEYETMKRQKDNPFTHLLKEMKTKYWNRNVERLYACKKGDKIVIKKKPS